MTAGRVGKPHGRDGSFYVEGASHSLDERTEVTVGGAVHAVDRRAGTDERPLVRLAGLEDPRTVRGEVLLVDVELADDEWLAADLERCVVPGHGRVLRVLDGPSCSVLELEDGTLVPFVSDAIRSVGEGEILVDDDFIG